MSAPTVNRDGEWVIYRRHSGRVEEHPEAEARRLLAAGSHVVRYGDPPSPPGTWDDASEPTWPLKTSPEDYLERSPDGPNAALARTILGLD